MSYSKVTHSELTFQSNLRAESHPATHRAEPNAWNDLCDEVLIPVGSLFFVFLVCAAVILLH